MAVIVVLVLRHAGDISGLDAGCKQQLEGENAVQAAVEGRGDSLCVFPQADGVDGLWPFPLIVVRDVGGDELADGERLCPGVGIGGIEGIKLEIVQYFLCPGAVPDGGHPEISGVLHEPACGAQGVEALAAEPQVALPYVDVIVRLDEKECNDSQDGDDSEKRKNAAES